LARRFNKRRNVFNDGQDLSMKGDDVSGLRRFLYMAYSGIGRRYGEHISPYLPAGLWGAERTTAYRIAADEMRND